MARLNHVRNGSPSASARGLPIVFVHGFACDLTDWDAQVRHFSARHDTIAVDLPGHGKSPGTLADACIEASGAAVAGLLDQLNLSPAVLVGHSMGCRVIVEAMRASPARVAGLVLVDGSRLGWPGGAAADRLRETFATADGYDATVESMFRQMFLPAADPAIAEAIVARARTLPKSFGAALLPALVEWDEHRFDAAFGANSVPMLVVQSTYTDPERRRLPMRKGQNTPYFDVLRRLVPDAEIEIVETVGHFPQIERADEVNAMIERFLARHAIV